eukprot:TRINITY_DN4527_c0_g1_i1.p1 TRINITY_DN4527_c0_g1~~TRINITY_DN4527_c0_g1_i1.p1  ORF type:complete len:1113 (+),score=446.73 TRINITY_DN4527_c0_g1_i1:200-3538(+)
MFLFGKKSGQPTGAEDKKNLKNSQGGGSFLKESGPLFKTPSEELSKNNHVLAPLDGSPSGSALKETLSNSSFSSTGSHPGYDSSEDSPSHNEGNEKSGKKLKDAKKREKRNVQKIEELTVLLENLTEENTKLIDKLDRERIRYKAMEETFHNLEKKYLKLKEKMASSEYNSEEESKDNSATNSPAFLRKSNGGSASPDEKKSPSRKNRLSLTWGKKDKDHHGSGSSSPQAESPSELSSDERKMSLESMTKADLLKEQLGSKYSNFAKLRRTQMEQLTTRKKLSSPSGTLTQSNSGSKTLEKRVGSLGEPDKKGALETLKKDTLAQLLNSRKNKEQLIEQGILTASMFGSPLESVLSDGQLPPFLASSFQFLIEKGKKTPKIFSEISTPISEENKKKIETPQWALPQDQPFYSDSENPKHIFAILIQFCNQLPDPMFTFLHYNSFASWTEVDEEGPRLEWARSLIGCLPSSHRLLLKNFMEFATSFLNGSETSIDEFAAAFGPIWLKTATSNNTLGEDYLKQLDKLDTRTNQVDRSDAGSKIIKFLINNPIVFEPEEGVEYIMKDGHQIVAGGSPQKIVEKLLDPFYSETDSTFIDVILLTHQYFFTSTQLLEELVKVWNKPAEKSWQKDIQSKAMRILKTWIGNYSVMLTSNKEFIESFKKFVQSDESLKSNQIFQKFLSIADEKESDKDNKPQESTKNLNREVDIDDFDPYAIALQMTLIDHELLQKIKPQEFLDKAFSYPDRSPNYTNMANQWNTTTSWVISEILKREKVQKRASVLSHLIKIAEMCRSMNNFNGAYAILVALNHFTISRLEKTWERLTKKSLTQMDSLSSLFEMSSNYKTYRNTLASSNIPIIPYIGLVPKDITSLEESPTKLPSGLINVGKLRNLSKSVNQIRQYQSSKFKIDPNPELSVYLRHPDIFTELQFREYSEAFEPSKRRAGSIMSDSSPYSERTRSDSVSSTEVPRMPHSSSRDGDMRRYLSDLSDSEDDVPITRNKIRMRDDESETSDFSESDSENESSVRAPRNSRAYSVSDDDLLRMKSTTGSLSAKDKAALAREMLAQKYNNMGSMRKEQIQRLGQGRSRRVQAYKGENAFAHAIEELSDGNASEDF